MRDKEALATSVVLLVKTALAPVLERLAAAEARLSVLGDLRDRVVTVESKSALPAVQMLESVSIDLVPIMERIAAAEARLSTLGDLRDRVVVVETKAAVPPRDVSEYVEALRDRIGTLEARAANPSTADIALMEIRDKFAASDITKELGALRERLAIVETRAPVPGPSGQPGKDGLNGKDGADGLGFDDLQTVQEDNRSFTIKAVRGDRVKDIGTATFPGIPIQRGVYIEGKSYDSGDVVTWAGSQWFCNEPTTTKPGDGLKAWTLIVKRGRDGKDGKDGPPGPMGPPGLNWEQMMDAARAR